MARKAMWVTAVALLGTWVANETGRQGLASSPQNSVTTSLVADTTAVLAGTPFTVAVKFEIPAGYYTYYRNPGDFGLPTKVLFGAPPGFQVGPERFPGPEIKREEVGEKTATVYMYRRNVMVLSQITPPENLAAGQPVTVTAQVSYQYCQDSGLCYPPKPATLKLSLPGAANRAAARPSADATAIESSRRGLPESGRRSKYAKVHAVLSQDKLRPGDRATLGVVVQVDDGMKLQPHRPDPGLIPTEVILDGVGGIETAEPIYPDTPGGLQPASGANSASAYRGQFVIRVPVTARDAISGSKVHFSGLLRYQACTVEGTCYPPRFASFELDVPVGAKGEKTSPANMDILGTGPNAKKASTRNVRN
jgi:DsbC/DsbD-like thiol-disulfide interchange protein